MKMNTTLYHFLSIGLQCLKSVMTEQSAPSLFKLFTIQLSQSRRNEDYCKALLLSITHDLKSNVLVSKLL